MQTDDDIDKFSYKYAVESELIKAYVSHLTDLKGQKTIRERERANSKRKNVSKTFHNYCWEELVQSGSLRTLFVTELNKYLNQYNLSCKGSKKEKIKRITFHVLQSINNAEKGDRNISEKSVDYDDQCFSQGSTEHEDTETDDKQHDEIDDDIALAQLLFGKNKPKSDNGESENVSDNDNDGDSDDDVVLAALLATREHETELSDSNNADSDDDVALASFITK